MLNSQSSSLPPLPSLSEVPTVPEEQTLPFNPLDQRYVATKVIKALTVEQLSKLELEQHNLRLAYVAHGYNADIKFDQSNSTIGTEIERIGNAIHNIEKVFGSVLDWQEEMQ